MDDLISEFITETVEGLAELDMDLVKLEQNPEDEELLGKIFRLMHTIKGTCGFLGLPRLEKTAHAAENLLDLFRSGEMEVNPTAMTLLFISIDRVRFLTSEVEENGVEPDGDDQDIISQIEAEIDKNANGGGGAVDAQNAQQESASEDENVIQESADIQVDAGEAKEVEEKSAEKNESEVVKVEEKPVAKKVEEKKVPPKAPKDKAPEYLRVQMGVLEDLINMVSELVLTRNQILQLMRGEEDSPANAPLQRLNRIVSDLQDGVMKTRMQPIGNAWAKLPRIVRDLSMELDKKLLLEMSGEDTELDRQVLEMIKDPLTHMVRNSCDHGVEMPADRAAAGKPETGTIHLKAYHEGGFIIVEISDDGKGLDAQQIGRKSVEKGLITEDQLETLSDKQLLQNIFKPGFSMAKEITNVSGRGVGMDVVRTNIEKIGGTIDMDSKLGVGTTFTIQIPLTLAIISGLIVTINGLRYAIPQLNIQELVRVQASQDERIEEINGKPVFRLRDRILPLIDGDRLFDGFRYQSEEADVVSINETLEPIESIEGAGDEGDAAAEGDVVSPDGKQSSNVVQFDTAQGKQIAVVHSGSSHFGLVVDAIHDTEEIVIKSISSLLKDTEVFAGNTILGDGEVIMILDPAGIARRFEVNNELNAMAGSDIEQAANVSGSAGEVVPMLVFQAGGDTPKAIPLALISRFQQFNSADVTESGDDIIVKYNNTLMPLYFVEQSNQTLDQEIVTTLILSDDVSDASMGLIIEHVIDIMEDTFDLTASTARPGVMGSATIQGTVVDVLDITHYLKGTSEDFFSMEAHNSTSFEGTEGDGKINVLIVDDSPFFRNMLKPILVAAGFNVTTVEDPLEAIKLHDQEVKFDVILSDIEMPNMNGYEFVEKMKDGSSWQDIPFIAITSHTTAQDVEYGYSKGFTKYIGKFDKEELLRTLNTVLSERPVEQQEAARA